MMKKTYCLYKMVEGVWVLWGKYTDPVRLAESAHFLGHVGVDEIKVESKEED